MRTTVDIDDPILKDLKKIQKREDRSLGRLISDLLAQALGERKAAKTPIKAPQWISKAMGAHIDIADHEAVYTAMKKEPRRKKGSKLR